ncbi:hypothetical protein QD172_01815 [Cobetia sp. 10Alg 146]|uniref:hypothetical protein n=1 Tax=Cobetia sp. 10Alg 146 TaxID=3040019 RepID=UPI00244B7EAE|nr:hypothetical protein [Cobetia sp. 10Alg 146]MDH2289987.1 hypothetical protein [Cobetia sp. 10Alg 146]
MMAALPDDLKRFSVLGHPPGEARIEFIEIDKDDARHFSYLGPYGILRFLKLTLLPRMAAEDQAEFAIEALTSEGWIEVIPGCGAPHETISLRLHPAGIAHFVEMAEMMGAQPMAEVLKADYLDKLVCPLDKHCL